MNIGELENHVHLLVRQYLKAPPVPDTGLDLATASGIVLAALLVSAQQSQQ